MEFWIVLGAAIALLAGYPYIVCAVKRVILVFKLRLICKRKSFRLHATHPLWFFGGRHGDSCDFYIETPNEILSVKLFGTLKKAAILLFTENGQYFTRRFIAFAANTGAVLRQYIDGKRRNSKAYQFRKGFRDEWEIKSPKNILLVNPVCHEIHLIPNHGAERILGNGDAMGDTVIYSLSGLIGYLDMLS